MTLKQKREQLKAMKKEAQKAAIRGGYSWGDHHRRQQISDLKKEIRNMQSSLNEKGDAPGAIQTP